MSPMTAAEAKRLKAVEDALKALPLHKHEPPPVVVPTPSPYTFEETFRDLRRWGQHWPKFGNAPFDPALVKLVPEGLSLGAARQPDGSFKGSLIDTKGTFEQRYGHFEARIRIPRGQGLWPAFWLAQPPAAIQPPEIDIVEVLANELGKGPAGSPGLDAGWLNTAVHFAGTAAQPIPSPKQADKGFRFPDLSLAFHNFGLDWRADRLRWFLDGTPLWDYTGPGIPQVPLCVAFDLAVGGDWGGPATAETPSPCAMVVAWVRVRA